jgi:hypothetical protein
MGQLLIVDRRCDFARFSLGESARAGAQILPLDIKLRYELSVANLCFCGIACTKAALFLTLANECAQII